MERPPKLDRESIVMMGAFAYGPHIEKLNAYIDYLEQSEVKQQFYCDGPLPAGYEIHMVGLESEKPVKTDRPRMRTKSRAQKIDQSWKGPWRKSGQGGLVVGDAWKHVTNAEEVTVGDGEPMKVEWGEFPARDTLYGRTDEDGKRVDPISDEEDEG